MTGAMVVQGRDLGAEDIAHMQKGSGLSISRNPWSPAPTGKKRGRRKETKPGNLLEGPDQHRGQVLSNLYGFCVLFGNNLAERDIRGMVVQ
jgi:hypothetical protein